MVVVIGGVVDVTFGTWMSACAGEGNSGSSKYAINSSFGSIVFTTCFIVYDKVWLYNFGIINGSSNYKINVIITY